MEAEKTNTPESALKSIIFERRMSAAAIADGRGKRGASTSAIAAGEGKQRYIVETAALIDSADATIIWFSMYDVWLTVEVPDAVRMRWVEALYVRGRTW
ncbi:hypothetical protein MTO96_024724 [Rhipicephalus appendiculatus]